MKIKALYLKHGFPTGYSSETIKQLVVGQTNKERLWLDSKTDSEYTFYPHFTVWFDDNTYLPIMLSEVMSLEYFE